MNIETADPLDAAPIDDLRREIDRLDAEILAAVKRRTEVSQAIGKARMASGGTRLVHSREMKVIERYSELGPEGKDLAMLLLRLGRGRLGHRNAFLGSPVLGGRADLHQPGGASRGLAMTAARPQSSAKASSVRDSATSRPSASVPTPPGS